MDLKPAIKAHPALFLADDDGFNRCQFSDLPGPSNAGIRQVHPRNSTLNALNRLNDAQMQAIHASQALVASIAIESARNDSTTDDNT